MTDDGATEQPVTEAQASAPALPPAPAADAPTTKVPFSAPSVPTTLPEVTQADEALGAAPAPKPIPLETSLPDEPLSTGQAHEGPPVAGEAVPSPTSAVRPTEVVGVVAAPATRRVARGVPPMLAFVSWLLVELVATVAAASMLFGLVLPAAGPADPGLLVERLGVTAPLAVLALLVAVIVGLPVGYVAARVGSWLDVCLRALGTLGAGLAPIWLAMLLVLLFSTTLRWLQPGGFVPWLQSPQAALASLVLPALALGLPLASELALRMRDALRVAQADPAIRSAEIMGLSRSQAIRTHALRNALADLARRATLPVALLVPASLVIENVFYLPGLGRLIFAALEARDFATLQLGLAALVTLVALCRLALKLLHAAADPRLARRA